MPFPYYDHPKDERLVNLEYQRTCFLTEDCQVRDVELSDLAEARKKWVLDWEANMRYMIEHETQMQEIEELMAGKMKLSEEKEDDSGQWSTLSNASTSDYECSISTDTDSTEFQDEPKNDEESENDDKMK